MRRGNKISFPRVNGKTVVFTGGVNEGITNLELRPGDLYQCLNYEETDGAFHGYKSIDGVERFDGQSSPSDVFVQLLPDVGNDSDTVLLLESEDSEDKYDKSGSSFPVSAGDPLFSTTRNFFGEGSWRFQSGSSTIDFDQTTDAIDFSTGLFTIEGVIQKSNSLTLANYISKADVFSVRISASTLIFDFSTDAGVSLNRQLSGGLTSNNRWEEFRVTVKDEMVYLGINGTVVDTLDITGETIHTNTSDIVIGDDTTIYPIFVDNVRISKIARSTSNYAYGQLYPYSDGRYYIFNADDVARETQRALITEVPGEGPIRDVHIHAGLGLAVRDKLSPDTTGGLYVESPSGWTELINSTYEFDVDNSSVPDATLSPVYGLAWTSSGGATGTMVSYTLETGNPVAGSGVGEASVIVDTGSLSNGDTITITSTTKSFDINAVPEVLFPGKGDYVDFTTGRLAYYPPNAPNSICSYFTANTHGIFATDADTFLYHLHGPRDLTDEVPRHCQIFSDRLWIAYEDGHLFYSAPGDPSNFSAEFGAGEIFLGDEIENMVVSPGGVFIIVMRNSIKIIKQTGEAGAYQFITEDFSKKSGGFHKTAVSLLGDVFYCDDRGPTSMKQTDAFGDYEISDIKKKTHLTYQQNKTKTIGAYVHRSKNQYRIFFNDPNNLTTKAIFITFASKEAKGATLAEYPFQFTCFHEDEDTGGNIKILAGADDGMVYRMDKGVSFDGQNIVTRLTTAYYHYGTPRLWKRFYRILFEISAQNRTQFFIQPKFNYGSSDMLTARKETLTTVGQGGVWGFSQWGSFLWGGSIVSNPMVYTAGYGYNMGLQIATVNKHQESHTIHNMVVDYANGSRVM